MGGPQHSHVTIWRTDYWQTLVAVTDIFIPSVVTVIVSRYQNEPWPRPVARVATHSYCSVRLRIATRHLGNMARYRCALLLTIVTAVLAEDLVVLKQGRIKGHRLTTRKGREIFAFQGIPFAKPPVGNLRFQVRSTGVREVLSTSKHRRDSADNIG
jgi:hypothetical protein